jgi:HlyD family secretion protein
MRKWIIILVVVAIVAAAGYFIWTRARAQAAVQALSDLQTVNASRGDLMALVGGTGQVRSNQTAVLSWNTSGVVDEVLVNVEDEVKADQELANLKTSSISQNVILAQADLANAQIALENLNASALDLVKSDQAILQAEDALRKAQERLNGLGTASQADIDSAEATVLLAKIQMDKAWDKYEPFKNKPESNQIRAALYNQYTQAQKNYDSAVRRLNNLLGKPSELTYSLAQADLDVAKANLEDTKAKLEDLKTGPDPRDIMAIEARITAAQVTLDSTHIKAPFAGTITEVYIMPGDLVSAGTTAFRLDDLSHLLVDVPISEIDISQVEIGQEALITFDAIPDREYQGIVTEVAQVGTVNQGVVDFNVTVELTDADEDVKPGMTAAVNIIINQLLDVLLVPNRAVRLDNGEKVVYILKNGVPEPVKITLGATSDTNSQVLEGDLAVGDEIILNPPEQLFEFGRPPSFMRNMQGLQP